MLKDLLSNVTYTQNGAVTNKSTNSKLLDFFAQGGSSRNKTEEEIIHMFEEAFAENPRVATVLLFYFRDIRGGQGERRLFRVIINSLAKTNPKYIEPLLPLIPEYGRWDDVYSFVGTPLEVEAFQLMRKQWNEDHESEFPSLLGKWLKGTSSSAKAYELAKITYGYFNISERSYAKGLSRLRAKIKITERAMSLGQWETIDYSKVPSHAMKRYFKAFMRNDRERFSAYLESLQKGENGVKVNAATLYPHEITKSAIANGTLADAQWKALPKFNLENTLPIIDVSASMMHKISPKSSTSAMDVSIGLGMYAAENLTGDFKNHFITFSETPQLVKIEGESLAKKVMGVRKSNWGGSTNLQGVFDMVLSTARLNGVPQNQMPERILVISDMEFNEAFSSRFSEVSIPNHEAIKEKYSMYGYKMPQVVYWNVLAATSQFPISSNEFGLLVSGYSPSILGYILKGDSLNPVDLMMKVYEGERYLPVRKTLENC